MSNPMHNNNPINIEIVCRGGLTLTDGIFQDVHRKIAPLQKFFDNILKARVILSVNRKFQHTAEVTVHLPPKTEVFAKHTAKDLYAAVDELIPKLERQIVTHKEKIKSRSKTSPLK